MQIAVQRILLAAAIVAFVAAAVVGATGAFFSDTETSTGNTFTSGAIDLKVDSESHYAGLICADNSDDAQDNPLWEDDLAVIEPLERQDLIGQPCDGTWEQTDLGPTGFEFFNFSDIKPGDWGENTISLHVYDNDAYMCAIIDNMEDVEVDESCTEPEAEDGDVTCALDTPQLGELADELHFFSWLDQGTVLGWQCPADQPRCTADPAEGDNIWAGGQSIEIPLFSNVQGPASDVLDGVVYPLFTPDVNGGAVMEGSTTYYLGMYWCYGTIGGLPAGPLICDGAPVNNVSQTDKLTADITFYAEQSRNNEDFVCPGLERSETATLVVDKIVAFSSTQIAGVDVTDFTLHINNGAGIDQDVIDEADNSGLPAGTYTISEVYSGDPAGVSFNASFSGACTEVGDTGEATLTLNSGDDVTCTITNTVSPI